MFIKVLNGKLRKIGRMWLPVSLGMQSPYILTPSHFILTVGQFNLFHVISSYCCEYLGSTLLDGLSCRIQLEKPSFDVSFVTLLEV